MYLYVMIRQATLIIAMMTNGDLFTTHAKLDLIKDRQGNESLRDKLYLSLRTAICNWEEFPLPKREVFGHIGSIAGYNPFLSLLKFDGRSFPSHWPKCILKAAEEEFKAIYLEDRDWFVAGEEMEIDNGFPDATNPEVFVPVWANDAGGLGESLPLDGDGVGESNVVLDKFTEWVASTLDHEVDLDHLQHMDSYGIILKQYAALIDGRNKHVGLFDIIKGWIDGTPHLEPKRDSAGRLFLNDSRGNKRYYDKAVDMLLLYCTVINWDFVSQGRTVQIPYCLNKFWQYGRLQAQEKAVDEICTYRKDMVELIKSKAFSHRVNLAKTFMTDSQKQEITDFITYVKNPETPKEFTQPETPKHLKGW